MSKVISTRSIMMACLLSWLLAFASMAQAGGTFRFLTTPTQLPDGSTDREYFYVLLTANAAGPISFTKVSLPPGLSLDPQTGTITGKPTVVDPNSSLKITASDGTNTIQFNATIKITATGGGGNGGLHIDTNSLPLVEGQVNTPYSDTITASQGTAPYIWGAQNLPTGLSLNGLTGAITGKPVSAGTFHVTFTLTDAAPHQIVTTVPLTILPEASQFRFATYLLNNGEVGTVYSDTWLTTGAAVCSGLPDPNQITYAAAGLPDGLNVDVNTGVVSGTPLKAGTFSVNLTATDCAGKTITTNLWMWIVSSNTSHFYWNYFGIPAAIYGTVYGDSNFKATTTVAASNGSSVTYSAIGLPSGINYAPDTGFLSGTSFEPGVYPVVFTATDTGPNPDVVITLATDFIVLPPNGGDTNSLAVNLWVKRLQVDAGLQGNDHDDSWSATLLYNANRTTGALFDPATDTFYTALAESEIDLAPGNLEKITSSPLGMLSYETPTEEAKPGAPSVKVRIAPRQQTIFVEARHTHLGTGLPADLLPNVLILGGKSFKLKEYLDAEGNFRTPFGYRSAAFVAVSGLTRTDAAVAAKNFARFSLLLADPAFDYAEGDPAKNTVRIRLMDGQSALVDKDLTSMVEASSDVDRDTGTPTFGLKKTWHSDPANSNKLAKFSFDSASGKLGFELKAPTLAALTNGEEQLGIEITIGSKTYFTSVTLFKIATSRYSTAQ